MQDPQIKEWYRKNVDHTLLHNLVTEYNKKGYTLDKKSGLMFRQPFSADVIESLGHTVVDIVFPRPVDHHYHEDVGEALSVTEGSGALYTRGMAKETPFRSGDSIFIPRGLAHSFRPDKNSFLEIRLMCTGIMNSDKEVCLQRFNEFSLWVDYFNKSE